jgi:hypothetical protein
MKPLTIVFLVAVSYPLYAQVKHSDIPGTKKTEIHSVLEPREWGQTLRDLAGRADLIVEGMVDASNLPSTQPDPTNHPYHIETDVVFLISKFIKGSLPNQKTFPRVVIAENGGVVGSLRVTVQEPPMEQGEHWILFLEIDNRTYYKAVAGLPRYSVIGAWNGKFKVERNGQISVPKHSLPDLRTHDNEDHGAFVARVSAAVAATKQ